MEVYCYTESCRQAGRVCPDPTKDQLRADVILAYSGTRDEIISRALADYAEAREGGAVTEHQRCRAIDVLRYLGVDTSEPLTLKEMLVEIKALERELCPGSETSLWGDFLEDLRKQPGVTDVFGEQEDVPLSVDFVEHWREAYDAYDPTPAQ